MPLQFTSERTVGRVGLPSNGAIGGMQGEMSKMIFDTTVMVYHGHGARGEYDAFDFRHPEIITTNEHASSTLIADEAPAILHSTTEHGVSSIHAGGGWDPTSVASPRDAASGYIEAEWLDF